jgi:hypothetical protein
MKETNWMSHKKPSICNQIDKDLELETLGLKFGDEAPFPVLRL